MLKVQVNTVNLPRLPTLPSVPGACTCLLVKHLQTKDPSNMLFLPHLLQCWHQRHIDRAQ